MKILKSQTKKVLWHWRLEDPLGVGDDKDVLSAHLGLLQAAVGHGQITFLFVTNSGS